MDKYLRHIIQKIHDCHTEAAVVVSGAGTQALAWLFGVAGASRTMLEARVPYAGKAFQEFIGRPPGKYVSGPSARLLAGNALRRARLLSDSPQNLVGLGCTATISTDYVKRGDHKAEIAAWTAEKITTYSLLLAKGRRDRQGEEEIVSRLIIYALADACGFGPELDLTLLEDDQLDIKVIDLAHQVTLLLNETADFIGIYPDGRIKHGGINPQLLLAGSFNPLHQGHLGMAAAAEKITGQPVAFELSAVNVDKPPLPTATILQRMAQFAGRCPLYITRTPTFIEKIRLFPQTTFVVGYDTAERIVAPRYYDHSREHMLAALAEMRDLGGRFLVAGRVDDEGEFRDVADLELPAEFAELFTPIPADVFRMDISSTELRVQRRPSRN